MASIYKKRGRWYGCFTDFHQQGGRREALVPAGERAATTDRKVAKDLFDRRYSELVRLRFQEPADPARERGMGIPLLEPLLRAFIQARTSFVGSREPIQWGRHSEVILTFFKPTTQVSRLTVGDLEDFVTWLKDKARTITNTPFSDNTQRKILDFLGSVFDWGRNRGMMSANPVRMLDSKILPSLEPVRETDFYSIAEAGTLLTALQRNADGSRPADWPKHAPDYVFEQVAFALLTGARLNEIKVQRWEWIEWDRSLVRLYTSKRSRGRDRHKVLMRAVPLVSQLREVLLSYWNRNGQPSSGLMFAKRKATHPAKHLPKLETGGACDKALSSILELRGIQKPGRHWREFRITYCATRLQTVEPVAGHPGEWVGVAHRTVELEMGHANEKMIKRVYGRVSEGPQLRLREVAYPIEGASRLSLRSGQAR